MTKDYTAEIRKKVKNARETMHELNRLIGAKVAENDLGPAWSIEMFIALKQMEEALKTINSKA